ncbi:ZIP family metal transporter [Kitasatospora sp. NPDC093679]|uniref:ZIP family metal transporter n=1 Tax=Kitasatospora sp. NPDC093679 TaxID=3154983 RepID=UPI00341C7A83
MSGPQIALLGAVAGVTVFLGLPVARLRRPVPRLRAALNAGAIGVLLFLLWDILGAAWEPTDEALSAHHWGTAAQNGLVLAAGLAVGLLGLVRYERWAARRNAAAPPRSPGPGAAAATERAVGARSHAAGLALTIATGIGLHNFAEGLAIGNSATQGDISLAVLLVIGFGLHNATEGFGIVAPLAAAGERPSWGGLAVLGVIAGGPTFVGTLIGQRVVDETVGVAFLGLAAGSILYVVIELLAVARRAGAKELTAWMILLGLLLGFGTDAVLVAAGV